MAKVKKQQTQRSTANLKKVLKANMEDSSQKMKVVNGQPALKTKGTNSVKELLGAKTSKKKRTKKPTAKLDSTPAAVEIVEKAPPQKSAASKPLEAAAGNSKENLTAAKKPGVNVASSEKSKPSNNWLLFKSQMPATNPQKQYWRKNVEKPTKSPKSQFSTNVTDVVAIDCEMVGGGENGKDNLLARVSVVNKFNEVLYDTFVKPLEAVTDYRTQFSGVRESDLATAAEFKDAQKKVAELIDKKILVGHDIRNDLKVLLLGHPFPKIRDTAKYHPFKQLKSGRPSLKFLSEEILGIKIQHGEHNSIEDAKAAMSLYMMHQNEWERLRKEKKVPKDKVADKSRMRKNWERTNNANKWHSQSAK